MARYIIDGEQVTLADFIKWLESEGRKSDAAKLKRRTDHGRSHSKPKTTGGNRNRGK